MMHIPTGSEYEYNLDIPDDWDTPENVEVVSVNEHEFDHELDEIKIRKVESGEILVQYRDSFVNGYSKVSN